MVQKASLHVLHRESETRHHRKWNSSRWCEARPSTPARAHGATQLNPRELKLALPTQPPSVPSVDQMWNRKPTRESDHVGADRLGSRAKRSHCCDKSFGFAAALMPLRRASPDGPWPGLAWAAERGRAGPEGVTQATGFWRRGLASRGSSTLRELSFCLFHSLFHFFTFHFLYDFVGALPCQIFAAWLRAFVQRGEDPALHWLRGRGGAWFNGALHHGMLLVFSVEILSAAINIIFSEFVHFESFVSFSLALLLLVS